MPVTKSRNGTHEMLDDQTGTSHFLFGLPKTKTSMAQQEIGGGYGSSTLADRYNPSVAKPRAPGARQAH